MVGSVVGAFTLYTIEYYKEMLHPTSVGARCTFGNGKIANGL